MGGVLFLDEAYSLGSKEKRDSFAKEAIDMINQYLSERKNDFMFVIAGYEKELDDCFFSINPEDNSFSRISCFLIISLTLSTGIIRFYF